MDNFWTSIKSFFANLGHTFMGYIIDALPYAKQLALQAITAIIDEVIAYIEAKYSPLVSSLKALEPLSVDAKLKLDADRRQEAFIMAKQKISEAGLQVSDSLINFHIELSVQKMKTDKEGNHGNLPGGNSNG